MENIKQTKISLGKYKKEETVNPEIEETLDRYLASGGKGGFHSFIVMENKNK